MRAAKPHRRPKVLQIFHGTIELDELHARGARLTLHKGCERRAIDKEGDVISEIREPFAMLPANRDDRLIVMGPGLHEVDAARVITVYPSGERYYVKLSSGAIDKTTTRVKVIRGGKA